MHPRTQIRQQVAAMLTTQSGAPPVYPTDCAARVFPNRIKPYQLKNLPAISIYTVQEPIDKRESYVNQDPDNPGILKRELRLAVEIVASGDEQEDDAVDRIALQVETVMDSDPSLGKLVEYSMLDDTSIMLLSGGEEVFLAARLIYLVTYRTRTITPAAISGVLPTTVYGSWAPNIGAAHINDYVDITDTGVPPDPGPDPQLP